MATELLTLVLTAYKDTIDMLPDYPERRREAYEELLDNYTKEIESDDPDSRLVYKYNAELRSFFKEIKSS